MSKEENPASTTPTPSGMWATADEMRFLSNIRVIRDRAGKLKPMYEEILFALLQSVMRLDSEAAMQAYIDNLPEQERQREFALLFWDGPLQNYRQWRSGEGQTLIDATKKGGAA